MLQSGVAAAPPPPVDPGEGASGGLAIGALRSS